jgi:glycolate oxidase iron-sulfur subunit
MLEGCVMPELFGRVNRATARVLAAAGFDVVKAEGHTCCGALHAHNGDMGGARALARSTVDRFERAAPPDTPIVVNSAGCGAHLKELGRVLEHDSAYKARAEALARRVVDFSQLLAQPDSLRRLAPQLRPVALPGTVTWDDPCHLCHGQQVRSEPRRLVDAVPGLQRVEMTEPESCCGSAGIYSMLRPLDSLAVLDTRVFGRIRGSSRPREPGPPAIDARATAAVRRCAAATRRQPRAPSADLRHSGCVALRSLRRSCSARTDRPLPARDDAGGRSGDETTVVGIPSSPGIGGDSWASRI